MEAFPTDSEDFPNTFYTYEVTYFLNLVFPPNKQDLFTEILNPSYYSADYADEALALWKEIAVAECIEYLQYQLDKVNFEFTPGEKTYKTFEIILNDFSVSQVYGIICVPLRMHQSYILKRVLVKNTPRIALLARANATQSAQKSTGGI